MLNPKALMKVCAMSPELTMGWAAMEEREMGGRAYPKGKSMKYRGRRWGDMRRRGAWLLALVLMLSGHNFSTQVTIQQRYMHNRFGQPLRTPAFTYQLFPNFVSFIVHAVPLPTASFPRSPPGWLLLHELVQPSPSSRSLRKPQVWTLCSHVFHINLEYQ